MGGGHRGLPHLPLVALSVAQQHVGARGPSVQPGGERRSDAEGEPLSQRAARHLDPGRLHVSVALEAAVQLAEAAELLLREIARLGERGVEHGTRVRLAQDEPVPVRPRGLRRPVPHDAEVERGEDLHGGERSARVSRSGLRHHRDDASPEPAGDLVQIGPARGDRVRHRSHLLYAVRRL